MFRICVLVSVGYIIGNFFKDRLIHMKDVMFLIVITNRPLWLQV